MVKPEGKLIPDNYFENSFEMNPHGIGYSYIVGEGDVAKIITKRFMKYNKFIKQYRKDEINNLHDTPFLIHFRACSRGVVNIDNTHPFKINDGQVFAHNGTIYGIPEDENKKRSDTNMFNETCLKGLPIGWETNESIKNLIYGTIGFSNNRLVVLNKTKEYFIFNEGLGVWDDGVWFSNDHYLGIYCRLANGKTILKSAFVIPDKDDWDRWERDYDNYIPGYREPGKIGPTQQTIFGVKDIDGNKKDNDMIDSGEGCDFCGQLMGNKKVDVVNEEFGDMYEMCNYCAQTLTSFGGIKYAN